MQRSAKILRFPPAPVAGPVARIWWESTPVIAALIFAGVLLLHAPLLSLPYFWDEAGYYAPAAHDLLLHFQFIPTSTITNAHPPLVMAFVALFWKIFGYHLAVARIASATIATFTLTGVFRLARTAANPAVALSSVICTALFPVFCAQSTMIHLDMAAAGFTLWGLAAYLRDQYPHVTLWFALALLAKETAILAPVALLTWELLGIFLRDTRWKRYFLFRSSSLRLLWLLISVIPLALWFAYHFRQTGIVFGNPEFVRYNVAATLHPVRILAAFAQRLWQIFGYMNFFVLTLAALLAMTRLPMLADEQPHDGHKKNRERPRVPVPVQLVFVLIALAYVLALSVIGGAVLARYLLPVYPLVVIVCVSTIWRRLPWWPAFLGIVCIAFLLGLVINPPYHFAPEDNLNYADFVRLHQRAAKFLEAHPPVQRVLTAWPASDELTKPYLGYVQKPLPILRIDDFSTPEIMAARDAANTFDVALLFSTKYEPRSGFLVRLPFWESLQKRYFEYHVDVPPAVAAELLQGRIVFQSESSGQWIAVLQMDRALNAQLSRP
jgi:hypothetical protein